MDWIEWFGYSASIIVAVSMVMSSIIRLRWINMIGASLFTAYGIIISAIPIALLNFFIVAIDVYFLYKIYTRKEYFKILNIKSHNNYLLEFLLFHKNEIGKFFADYKYSPDKNAISFFILRNMSVAGVFLAEKIGEKSLLIDLDYVIPEYRDFKLAKYIYIENEKYFIELGYDKLYSNPQNDYHNKYLKKMGFLPAKLDNKDIYCKELPN